MANVLKIKRGSSVPSSSDLAVYELGYRTGTTELYINDNGTYRQLGGASSGAVDSIANFSDNRLLTASDADSINGEANLTFDGSTLAVTGALTTTSSITPGSIVLGGHSFNDIDIGSEFVDTDDHLMSSGAIKEKIESYSYLTAAPVTALNNATENELVTVGSTTTELDAESTLTYGSSVLEVQQQVKVTDGTRDIRLNSNHGSKAAVGTVGSHDFNFFTANTIRATVDSGGNFGIGTESPSYNLHVKSASGSHAEVRIETPDQTSGSVPALSFNNGDRIYSLGVMTDESFSIRDGSDSWATRLSITTAGDVSIPTGSLSLPVAEKLFFGGGSHTYISEDQDDRLRFFCGGAEFMRFAESTTDTLTLYADNASRATITEAGLKVVSGALGVNTNPLSDNGSIVATNDIIAGYGGGGIALTINDGGGNANVTFNHRNKTPEQNGQSARIEVNTDATSTEGIMYFETSTADVTSGTLLALANAMTLAHDYMDIPYRLRHMGDTDTYMQYDADRVQFAVGGEVLLDLKEDGTQDYVKLGDGGDVDINLNDDMFIQGSSSNVGIGTTSPGALLTVYKDGTQASSVSTTYQIQTVSDSNGGIAIQAGDSSTAYLVFGDNADYDQGRIAYHNSTGHMDFYFNGTKRLEFMDDGQIHWGSAAAHGVLSWDTGRAIVGSSGSNNLDLKAPSGYAVVVNEAGSNVDFRVEGDSETNLIFADASADKVGIGVSSPNSLLHIADGVLSIGTGHDLEISHNGTHNYIDLDNGNLYFRDDGDNNIFTVYREGNGVQLNEGVLDLGSGNVHIKKTGGNNTNNYAAVEVYSAGTADNQAAIAIQQQTSEGDTIIFADFEPHVEWGISAENGDNRIDFTGGSSSPSLGTRTFKNNAGDDRTAYRKMSIQLDDGDVSIAGKLTVAGTNAFTIGNVAGAARIQESSGTFTVLTTGNAYANLEVDDLTAAGKIIHEGDTDTHMNFSAADTWKVTCGGHNSLTAIAHRVYVNASGANGLLINNDEGNSADSARIFFEGTSTSVIMQQGNDFSFRTGGTTGSSSGTERFKISSGGNCYATGSLDVTSTITTDYGVSFTNGDTDFLIYNNDGEDVLYMRDITNSAMLQTWGVSYVKMNKTLKSTENLELTAAKKLTFDGATANTYIQRNSGSSSRLDFVVNGTGVIDLYNTHLKVNKHIEAGDNSDTNGVVALAIRLAGDDLYNVWGSQYSSGKMMMGKCVKPKTGSEGFVSSADNAGFSREAVTMGSGLWQYYTAASATVAVGTDVTMTERVRFDASGNGHFDADVVAYSTTVSDQRLKDNVKTIDNAVDKIMKLRGVEFDWNATSRKGQHDLGLIAQEVEEVLPEVVREKTLCTGEFTNNEKEFKTVDYDKIIGVLIEAVKEQQVQIDELKTKLGD